MPRTSCEDAAEEQGLDTKEESAVAMEKKREVSTNKEASQGLIQDNLVTIPLSSQT